MTRTSRLEMSHHLSESVITNLCVHYLAMLGIGQGGALKDTLVSSLNEYITTFSTYACQVCLLLNKPRLNSF